MAANDLCTLAALRNWLRQESTDDDPLLAGLIASASGDIYANLNRQSLLQTTQTEVYDGFGRPEILLRQWPVLSVSAVSILGSVIPAAATPGPNVPPANGYLIDRAWDGFPPGRMQTLRLFGFGVPRGLQSVVVTYTSGYTVQNEARTVPAGGGLVSVAAPNGPWAADSGVTYANGTALTRVTGTPSAGQYQLDTTPGGYRFAAADGNAAVLIGYSFVPAVIQLACLQIAAERYKYRSHIGESSVTTQGIRTTSFDMRAIQRHLDTLASYRCVVPF